jgi:hypothetical protein
MIVASAIFLALLQLPEPADGTPFSDRQPVRLAPLPIEGALGAFRDVCMMGFPDPAAFDAAAAASGLDLVRAEEPQRGAQEWSSRHGHFVLREAPNRSAAERRDRREGRVARARWLVRCDFWTAVEERLEPPELLAAIGQRLAGGRDPAAQIFGASWELGTAEGDGSLKLVYLPTDDDPRLFTLSLQRLPASPPR